MTNPGVEINEPIGYVYMWCDILKEKYYIGSHKGMVQDAYKSSSKWVNNIIRKRPNTMKFRVLDFYYGVDRNELYSLEEKWLKFYNVKNNKNFYNLKNEARGGVGHFKHKGKKRLEYTPGWIDHRIGKTLEDIYKDPESVRDRLRKTAKNYYEEHGCGWKKGKKHSKDLRKGKTVEEIYGYRKLVNPNKPFLITISEPGKDNVYVYCRHEPDFHEKIKMDSYTLGILKRRGEKRIFRIQPSTKHSFQIGTMLYLKFVDDKN